MVLTKMITEKHTEAKELGMGLNLNGLWRETLAEEIFSTCQT